MNFESLVDLTTYLQRGISPKYAESGIPVINQKCIRNGRLKSEDIKFHCTDKTYSKDKELRKDDILVNSTGVGTLGRVARFSNKQEKMLADSHVTIIRPDVEKIFPLYLFYVLRFNESAIIELGAGSTGQTELSRTALGSLQIPIPSQSVQEYVAHTLACIDEKIDTNETLSRTLEDIAQAIFKSWFIDFDPVKVKIAGEKPAGMDAATVALFPDSLEESELGLIPKGWEVRKIESLCETKLGGTPSRTRYEFWGGNIPWINSGKVNDFRINVASEYITELGLEKSATKLLPKGTTVLAITGATLGQFSRLEIDSCANQSVVGILGSDEASNEFVYLNIKNGIQRLVSAQTGGAQQHINKEDVNSFLLVYPGKKLMKTFTDIVGDIFEEIGVLSNQLISLAEVRDSLLPRLISGELQIPEEVLAS